MGKKITSTIKGIVFTPSEFFSQMPKKGGYKEPSLFLILMIFVGLLINTIGTALFVGRPNPLSIPIILIVGTVIIFLACSFGAALLYGIWRVMGSEESFETAFRCLAYISAISPFTSLLSFIPVIGPLASIVWVFLLIILASIKVHHIRSTLAWAVWGSIGTIFFITTLVAQVAYRPPLVVLVE